jgi:hypothetical protein
MLRVEAIIGAKSSALRTLKILRSLHYMSARFQVSGTSTILLQEQHVVHNSIIHNAVTVFVCMVHKYWPMFRSLGC